MGKEKNWEIFRILVAGEPNSGKSSFIKQISEIGVVTTDESISTHDDSETELKIALDLGRLTTDDTTVVYFFGEPYSLRLPRQSFFYENVKKRAVVILKNAVVCNRYSFHIPALATFLRQQGFPFVFAVNRYDEPDALPIDKLARLCGIAEDEPVVLCNVINPIEVCDTLLVLLDQLPDDDAKQKTVGHIQSLRTDFRSSSRQHQPEEINTYQREQTFRRWHLDYYPCHTFELEFFKVQVVGISKQAKVDFIRQLSEIEPFFTDEVPTDEDAKFEVWANGVTCMWRNRVPGESRQPLAVHFGRFTVDLKTVMFLFADPDVCGFSFAEAERYRANLNPPESCGVVVLVDATRPDDFATIQRILDDLRAGPFRFILALDHGDAPNTLALDAVRSALGLHDEELIVPCNVADQSAVIAALLALLARFPQDDAVMQRVIAAVREI